MKRFRTLYTHQKSKKVKVWSDGTIIADIAGKKLTLYDEDNNAIDKAFVGGADIGPGTEMELNRFLIQVEDEIIEEKKEKESKTEHFSITRNDSKISNRSASSLSVNITKKIESEKEKIEEFEAKVLEEEALVVPKFQKFKRPKCLNNSQLKPSTKFVTPCKESNKNDLNQESNNIKVSSKLLFSKNDISSKINNRKTVAHIKFASDVDYIPKSERLKNPTYFSSYNEFKEYHIAIIKDSLQCSLDEMMESFRKKKIDNIDKESNSNTGKTSWFTSFDSKDLRLSYLDSGLDINAQVSEDVTDLLNMEGISSLQLNFKHKKDFSNFMKDDVWILALNSKFLFDETVMLRSIYHGCSGNSVQLCCLTIPDLEKLPKLIRKFQVGFPIILKGFNLGTEASIMEALSNCDGLDPMLNYLLNPYNGFAPPKDLVVDHVNYDQEEINESTIDRDGDQGPKIPLWDLLNRVTEEEKLFYIEKADYIVQSFITRYELNEDQIKVIQRYKQQLFQPQLNSPALLIHGVFGSGKSFLMSLLIILGLELSEIHPSLIPPRILVCCMTNVAVDTILENLIKLRFEEFIRVGSLKRINKRILPFTIQTKKKLDEDIKELKSLFDSYTDLQDKELISETIKRFQAFEDVKKLDDLLNKTFVVGSTCLATNFPSFENQKFDILIMDEVTQLTEGLSLLPVLKFSIKLMVLVGDPNQLPPTLTNLDKNPKLKLKFNQTLFDRLRLLNLDKIMLKTQYRCHPKISNLCNKEFYKNQLVDGVNTNQRLPLVQGLPTLSFIHIEKTFQKQKFIKDKQNYQNEQEMDLIVQTIKKLLAFNIPPHEIGVIAMFRAQVELIENQIKSSFPNSKKMKKAQLNSGNIQISTIDAFQGAEKSIILLSCVYSGSSVSTFLGNPNRVNVALSRAKNHLLIFGDQTRLSKSMLWRSILQEISKENACLNKDTFESLLSYLKPNIQQTEIEYCSEEDNRLNISSDFNKDIEIDSFVELNQVELLNNNMISNDLHEDPLSNLKVPTPILSEEDDTGHPEFMNWLKKVSEM